MIEALKLTAQQLPDRPFRTVVVLGMLSALILIIFTGIFSWFLISKIEFFGIGVVDKLASWIGGIIVFVGTLMFFPSTVMLVSGLFLDKVVSAVEHKHYPESGDVHLQTISSVIRASLTLLVVGILMNLMLLPVYLITFFIPGLNLLIFYLLNGYLLGREFYDMVAGRHLPPAKIREIRRANWWQITSAGIIIAVLTTIPGLNLIAPVAATAFMVHIFHRTWRKNLI